jgi:small subunit ribosomal protein S8e
MVEKVAYGSVAVVYNASNNELVRTKTLVKNCIVSIDAAPFKQW